MAANLNLGLSGKTALVCGASQGIGEAIARRLAIEGARVILVARSREKLTAIKNSLPTASLPHLVLDMDLSRPEGIGQHLQSLELGAQAIHILINNAGGPKGGPILQASPEEFVNAFKTHIVAAQTLAQLVIPGMQRDSYGRIINIISTSVRVPIANLGVSNTIRGAMASWAKSLANEVGPLGITVNNVLPGYTKTARLDALLKAAAEKQGTTTEVVARSWKESTPLRRFAEPTELAAAVAFLAGPEAGYISGTNLPVDGGRIPSL
jgi:3-oxoacyl-[acyl-carrier protein] reductase